ncbi:hypothetical protein [Noviherbaspirillum galbum]|uniref:Uncharacterized protein n=1 Tax=Noviherbaspirillum galbum TaxID=2709383 RepID=A0A6B3SXQ9_9BURK|nr:hypothetical protein [Noviherbaspirillum galbum]NEX63322.1 hypothetical protein [Noviherbaspirillum galbum]
MTTLTISDLTASHDLDTRAMSTVRGGTKAFAMPAFFGPSVSFASNEFNFSASQGLAQQQNTMVNNGNNVAFASDITSNVKPTQNGSNNISLF